eukprot:scaffold90928_cov36-Cyclotella_meneghiniana.AAC.3
MTSNKHGPFEGILPLFLLPLYILAFLQLILFVSFAILGHIVFDPITWLVSTGACESIYSTLSSIQIIRWLVFALAPSYVVTNGKRSLPDIDKENIRSPNDYRSNKKKRQGEHKHNKQQRARVIKTTSPPTKEFKELFSSHGASTTIIAIWWIIYNCAFENEILILAKRYITWLIGVDATNFDVDEFIARDTKYHKKVRKAIKKRGYAANLGDGIRKGVKTLFVKHYAPQSCSSYKCIFGFPVVPDCANDKSHKYLDDCAEDLFHDVRFEKFSCLDILYSIAFIFYIAQARFNYFAEDSDKLRVIVASAETRHRWFVQDFFSLTSNFIIPGVMAHGQCWVMRLALFNPRVHTDEDLRIYNISGIRAYSPIIADLVGLTCEEIEEKLKNCTVAQGFARRNGCDIDDELTKVRMQAILDGCREGGRITGLKLGKTRVEGYKCICDAFKLFGEHMMEECDYNQAVSNNIVTPLLAQAAPAFGMVHDELYVHAELGATSMLSGVYFNSVPVDNVVFDDVLDDADGDGGGGIENTPPPAGTEEGDKKPAAKPRPQRSPSHQVTRAPLALDSRLPSSLDQRTRSGRVSRSRMTMTISEALGDSDSESDSDVEEESTAQPFRDITNRNLPAASSRQRTTRQLNQSKCQTSITQVTSEQPQKKARTSQNTTSSTQASTQATSTEREDFIELAKERYYEVHREEAPENYPLEMGPRRMSGRNHYMCQMCPDPENCKIGQRHPNQHILRLCARCTPRLAMKDQKCTSCRRVSAARQGLCPGCLKLHKPEVLKRHHNHENAYRRQRYTNSCNTIQQHSQHRRKNVKLVINEGSNYKVSEIVLEPELVRDTIARPLSTNEPIPRETMAAIKKLLAEADIFS